jgi:hypothetical protein
MSNGKLIAAAEEAGIDVLLTADQGINYQQNLQGRRIAIVVLSTNLNSLVTAQAPAIAAVIEMAQPAHSSISISSHPDGLRTTCS